MKRVLKIIILLVIFVSLINYSEITKSILGIKTAYAVGDLSVDWGVPGGQPLFTIANMVPGQSQIRTVKVANGSSANRLVGISGDKTNETGNLSSALTITISQNGVDVYGGTSGEKTVAQFLTESTLPNFAQLSSLTPDSSANYVITVKFKDQAGNEFQNKTLSLNLTIGLAVDIPTSCQGISFTGKVITGSQNNDSLSGTSKNDLILGLEGNDSISGGGGNDCIIAGSGSDRVSGDNGNDVIDAGAGNDQVAGGNGRDTILSGDGNDRIDGGNGDDSISGSLGNDILTGGNGTDILDGGSGVDVTIGGRGTDTCRAETRVSCEL